ncbi:alpha/beta fold hydrolase [Aliidiomarina halalkaliphila]|uniref:Alpha/beta fold hydrolase n=1 Tax=Aliidiomarina halalkaliphila TaxID=2593535 RepID=A0A552X3G8_9GAMM|nr:alpha/beta fold hydrolase [Aliidiomarina halalkaliphila]TRW49535.1 alpha/beta fold hydrolase [Aliidiomarina halalkaliphila]
MRALRWFGFTIIALLIAVLVFVFYSHFKHFEESYHLNSEHRAKAPGQFVELSQGFTHYHVSGPADGPVVVLIHGFSIPSEVWGDTDAALAEAGFRVIRYDLYGRGYSDRPEAQYNHQLFVTQLIELLDALGVVEPVQLVGLSMGGAVTMHAAALHPERIKAAALIAPLYQPLQPPPMPERIGHYMISGFYVPGLRESLSADYLRPEQQATMKAAYEAQMRFRGFTRALTSSFYAFTTEDHPARYRATKANGMPVMLIWGTHDNIVPYRQHEGVIEDAHVANFLSVDGAGHTPHLEQPDEVNYALVRFLGRVL